MRSERAGLAANIGCGVLSGVAGTVVMTAFQKFVEMPITGRGDSYAPADFAERVLPVHPSSPEDRKGLNYVTHFSLGGMWGTAYGIAATAGLSGQKAVHTVFATVYTADTLVNVALGLYPADEVVEAGLDHRPRREVRTGPGDRCGLRPIPRPRPVMTSWPAASSARAVTAR
ncbi:hypothetical protein ACFW4O_36185 [Streptomyces mutabilis]|uniref:hypothetical protein n=1 Tax=Streptomyces mutabilis TaxID=67332 RepID=UPI00367C48B5